MNFVIRYLTEYRYDTPVTDNLNALRVRPATTATQRVDDFHVRIDPEARLARHTDYFGTEVIEFGIAAPHDHLSIDVSARVVTREPPETPAGALGRGRDRGLRRGRRGVPAANRRRATRRRPRRAALRRAREHAVGDRPPRLRADPGPLRVRPGSTYVGSTVADLLAAGGGVCQDFVHLALMLLRRHGIAARYVSGYLWAAPREGARTRWRSRPTRGSRRWCLAPAARGEPVWVGADPTNRRLAGETHVKIGHGRALRRRAADQGRLPGLRRGGPGRARDR